MNIQTEDPITLVGQIVLIDGQIVRRIIYADKTKVTVRSNPQNTKDLTMESWSRKTGAPLNYRGKQKRSIQLITMAQAMQYLK